MSFGNPVALWLLPALLVGLSILGYGGWKTKREIAGVFALEQSPLRRKQNEKYLAAGILGTLLILAAALPEVVVASFAAPERAGELALLVDVSGSMAAQPDLQSPNRLMRCQTMLAEIVDHLTELGQPRVSLHAFTNIARSHVPFVGPEDYEYLAESIGKILGIYSIPGQGSVLGQAILDVAPKFAQGKTVKQIVLCSDGEPFIGGQRILRPEERVLLDQAVDQAKRVGITVATVGVGERQGAKIPIYNTQREFTGEYAKLGTGDYVTYLMEDQLKEIAERTGGQYFTEDRAGELIPYLAKMLSAADPVSAPKQIQVRRSIAAWFVLASLPIWIFLVRRHWLD